jgi:U3 small nucleolar RNA-associated protein 14
VGGAACEGARDVAVWECGQVGAWGEGEGVSRDERMAVGEMLERGERLRRKIQGWDGSGEEGEEDDEADEADGDGDDIGRIKERAFEELGALNGPGEDGKYALRGWGKAFSR